MVPSLARTPDDIMNTAMAPMTTSSRQDELCYFRKYFGVWHAIEIGAGDNPATHFRQRSCAIAGAERLPCP